MNRKFEHWFAATATSFLPDNDAAFRRRGVAAPAANSPEEKPRPLRVRPLQVLSLSKRPLVTNHASLTGLRDPSLLFAIFDVFVNDKAGKVFKDDDDD